MKLFEELEETKYFCSHGESYGEHGYILMSVTWEQMRADQVVLFEGSPVEAVSHHAGDPHIAVRFLTDDGGNLRMDELVPIGEELDLKLARSVDGNTYEIIDSI